MVTSPQAQLFAQQPPLSAAIADTTALNQNKEKVVKKRKPWKKPIDKPKRPPSAYNLFFQLERERVLNHDDDENDSNMSNFYNDQQIQKVIDNQTEPKPKRKHRKSHGKIGFADLAKMIANNWKALPDHYRILFEKHASSQKEEYVVAVQQWQKLRPASLNNKKGATSSSMSSSRSPSHVLSNPIGNNNTDSNFSHSRSQSSRSRSPVSEGQIGSAATTANTTEVMNNHHDSLIGTTVPQGFWQTLLSKQQQDILITPDELGNMAVGNMTTTPTRSNDDMMTKLMMMNMMNHNKNPASEALRSHSNMTAKDSFSTMDTATSSITTDQAIRPSALALRNNIMNRTVTNSVNDMSRMTIPMHFNAKSTSMVSLLSDQDINNHETYGKVLPSCSSLAQLTSAASVAAQIGQNLQNESLIRQLSMNQLNQWNSLQNNNVGGGAFGSSTSLFEPLNMNDSTASLSNMAQQYNCLLRNAMQSSASMNQFHSNPIQATSMMKNAIFNIPSSNNTTANTNIFQNRMFSLNNDKDNNNNSTQNNNMMMAPDRSNNNLTNGNTQLSHQIFQDFAFRTRVNNNNQNHQENPFLSAVNLLQYGGGNNNNNNNKNDNSNKSGPGSNTGAANSNFHS